MLKFMLFVIVYIVLGFIIYMSYSMFRLMKFDHDNNLSLEQFDSVIKDLYLFLSDYTIDSYSDIKENTDKYERIIMFLIGLLVIPYTTMRVKTFFDNYTI